MLSANIYQNNECSYELNNKFISVIDSKLSHIQFLPGYVLFVRRELSPLDSSLEEQHSFQPHQVCPNVVCKSFVVMREKPVMAS